MYYDGDDVTDGTADAVQRSKHCRSVRASTSTQLIDRTVVRVHEALASFRLRSSSSAAAPKVSCE